jgi:hypothetical protein
MNAQTKFARMLAGTIVMFTLLWGPDRPAEATAPSGVTFAVLNRATVPEFDAIRRFKQKSDDTHRHRRRSWKIELEATRMIDVVTVLFTIQPGGHSGWHTHPGPALFTVSTGALTMYEGHDPSCTPQLFPAGTGSIEAGTSDHTHLLRNETGTVAETIVTFLLPVGAPIRTDSPNPGNCGF